MHVNTFVSLIVFDIFFLLLCTPIPSTYSAGNVFSHACSNCTPTHPSSSSLIRAWLAIGPQLLGLYGYNFVNFVSAISDSQTASNGHFFPTYMDSERKPTCPTVTESLIPLVSKMQECMLTDLVKIREYTEQRNSVVSRHVSAADFEHMVLVVLSHFAIPSAKKAAYTLVPSVVLVQKKLRRGRFIRTGGHSNPGKLPAKQTERERSSSHA